MGEVVTMRDGAVRLPLRPTRPRRVYPELGLVIVIRTESGPRWARLEHVNGERLRFVWLPDAESDALAAQERAAYVAELVERAAALIVIAAHYTTIAVERAAEAFTVGAMLEAARRQVEGARRVGFVREIPS